MIQGKDFAKAVHFKRRNPFLLYLKIFERSILNFDFMVTFELTGGRHVVEKTEGGYSHTKNVFHFLGFRRCVGCSVE